MSYSDYSAEREAQVRELAERLQDVATFVGATIGARAETECTEWSERRTDRAALVYVCCQDIASGYTPRCSWNELADAVDVVACIGDWPDLMTEALAALANVSRGIHASVTAQSN